METTNTHTTMSKYIDGFLIPVPKTNLEKYRAMASLAGKIWKEHGALEYIEAAGDDFPTCDGATRPAPEHVGAADDETLVFAYIVYESREHRDAVNARVMADPRMHEICPGMNQKEPPPFDVARMIYGGFKSIVEE